MDLPGAWIGLKAVDSQDAQCGPSENKGKKIKMIADLPKREITLYLKLSNHLKWLRIEYYISNQEFPLFGCIVQLIRVTQDFSKIFQ